jgi:hypothetical protein
MLFHILSDDHNGIVEGIVKMFAEANDPVVKLKIFTMN